MPGAEVVKKAKAAGLTISLGYVYSIRARAHRKAPGKGQPARTAPEAAPRRSKRQTRTTTNGGATTEPGLVAAIEAIVERKVRELLKARLGALFGG